MVGAGQVFQHHLVALILVLVLGKGNGEPAKLLPELVELKVPGEVVLDTDAVPRLDDEVPALVALARRALPRFDLHLDQPQNFGGAGGGVGHH